MATDANAFIFIYFSTKDSALVLFDGWRIDHEVTSSSTYDTRKRLSTDTFEEGLNTYHNTQSKDTSRSK